MAPPTLTVAISRSSSLRPFDSPTPRLRSRRNRLRQTDGGADQIRLGQRRSPQLAGDRALVHNQRPVAETDYLGKIGREKEDSMPFAGQTAHQLVDLLFRADVDAAGRIVQEIDGGVGEQREIGRASCRERVSD